MTKALILAGGKGTRLSPVTKAVNKHLLLVFSRPLIFYPIETLREAGVTDIVISLSHDQPEQFMKLLGDGRDLGVNLTYAIHGEPKGIAYAINHAKPWLENEPFICHLGDNIFCESIKTYVEQFQENPDESLMIFKDMGLEEARRYGTAEFDKDGEVVRFLEKPEVPPNTYAMLGLYLLTPKFFDVYHNLKPSWRREYEITDAVNLLLPDVDYAFYHGAWFDCGTFHDLLKAANYMRDRENAEL